MRPQPILEQRLRAAHRRDLPNVRLLGIDFSSEWVLVGLTPVGRATNTCSISFGCDRRLCVVAGVVRARGWPATAGLISLGRRWLRSSRPMARGCACRDRARLTETELQGRPQIVFLLMGPCHKPTGARAKLHLATPHGPEQDVPHGVGPRPVHGRMGTPPRPRRRRGAVGV